MKEVPVKVQVLPAQEEMQGKYCIVIVIEGFEKKEEANDHAHYLGPIISNAGVFKNEVHAEVAKEARKPKHIKLLTD